MKLQDLTEGLTEVDPDRPKDTKDLIGRTAASREGGLRQMKGKITKVKGKNVWIQLHGESGMWTSPGALILFRE